MSFLKVEIAGPGDAEALGHLHYISHIVSFAPFTPTEWINTRQESDYVKRWKDALSAAESDPRSCAWKVVDSCTPVGTVRIHRETDTHAQLNSMHVHPDHHRRGIGNLLMEAATEFMKKAGYLSATLGVIQANTGARAFYEHHNWAVDELFPTGVEGVPIAVYRLRLD